MLLKCETGKNWTTYREVPIEGAAWVQFTTYKRYVALSIYPDGKDSPDVYELTPETAARVRTYLDRRMAAGLDDEDTWCDLIDKAHTIDTTAPGGD